MNGVVNRSETLRCFVARTFRHLDVLTLCHHKKSHQTHRNCDVWNVRRMAARREDVEESRTELAMSHNLNGTSFVGTIWIDDSSTTRHVDAFTRPRHQMEQREIFAFTLGMFLGCHCRTLANCLGGSVRNRRVRFSNSKLVLFEGS
jgi:hypothetical protein